jgi:hypothetical protein
MHISGVDKQAANIKWGTPVLPAAFTSGGEAFCPQCDCRETHVVDVLWERDLEELDRRRVRIEFRCEAAGHGWLMLLRNHGGVTRIEIAELQGILSPFAEGVRW